MTSLHRVDRVLEWMEERQGLGVEGLRRDELAELAVLEGSGRDVGPMFVGTVGDEQDLGAAVELGLGQETVGRGRGRQDLVACEDAEQGETSSVVVGPVRDAYEPGRAQAGQDDHGGQWAGLVGDEVAGRLLADERELFESHGYTAVVAPSAADPTVRAYFASTPRV